MCGLYPTWLTSARGIKMWTHAIDCPAYSCTNLWKYQPEVHPLDDEMSYCACWWKRILQCIKSNRPQKAEGCIFFTEGCGRYLCCLNICLFDKSMFFHPYNPLIRVCRWLSLVVKHFETRFESTSWAAVAHPGTTISILVWKISALIQFYFLD